MRKILNGLDAVDFFIHPVGAFKPIPLHDGGIQIHGHIVEDFQQAGETIGFGNQLLAEGVAGVGWVAADGAALALGTNGRMGIHHRERLIAFRDRLGVGSQIIQSHAGQVNPVIPVAHVRAGNALVDERVGEGPIAALVFAGDEFRIQHAVLIPLGQQRKRFLGLGHHVAAHHVAGAVIQPHIALEAVSAVNGGHAPFGQAVGVVLAVAVGVFLGHPIQQRFQALQIGGHFGNAQLLQPRAIPGKHGGGGQVFHIQRRQRVHYAVHLGQRPGFRGVFIDHRGIAGRMLPEEFLRPGADQALRKQAGRVAAVDHVGQLIAGRHQADLGGAVGFFDIDQFERGVVALVHVINEGGVFAQRDGGIGGHGVGVMGGFRQRNGGHQRAQQQRGQQQGQCLFHDVSSFIEFFSLKHASFQDRMPREALLPRHSVFAYYW